MLVPPSSLGAPAYDDQGLRTFFAKPIRLVGLDWAIASLPGDTLYFTDVITALKAQSMWADKLKGFRYFRGTAVFRLQVNAQPFQQGRLIMYFNPHEKHMDPVIRNWRLDNLACYTQLPHVELDCRDTTAVIKIPYVAPTAYVDLVDELIDWGRLHVSVLSPLDSGDGSALECSVWLNFEDVEFAGPIVPQSGMRARRTKIKARSIGSMPIAAEEAAIATAGGPVTKFIGKAQSVASVLSGVPLLSTVAAPAVWALGLAGKVTGVFGWSKPNSDSAASYYIDRPLRHVNNSNGLNMSESMAMIADPSVSCMPSFAGTDEDEMSFGYLKTHMTYVSSFDWSLTDPHDATLYDFYISPRELGYSKTFALPGVNLFTRTYPPMFKIAQHFKYYRGGIKLHIKIVKTDYHSGRLDISFVPSHGTVTPPTTLNASYALREIVDIRETSEIVLTLPFLQHVSYLDWNVAMGRLTIKVLNELRAPEAAANNVQVLMYYGPADDFEVAVPRQTIAANVYPQAGDEGLNSETLVTDKPIGNAKEKPFDFFHSTVCIGELVTSIKMMLSRYRSCFNPIDAAEGTMLPWHMTMQTISIAAGAKLRPVFGVDMFSELSLGYSMYRGSVRMNLIPNVEAELRTALTYPSFPHPVYQSITPEGTFDVAADEWLTPLSESQTTWPKSGSGALLNIPYYNQTPSSLVIGQPRIGSSPALITQPKTALSFVGDSSVRARRAAGEDFQLGYFAAWGPQLYALS